MPEENKFYVGVFKKNGRVTGHSSASSADLAKDPGSATASLPSSPSDSMETKSAFADNMADFISIMETYRSFVPMTIGIGTALVPAMTELVIDKFVKKKGELVSSHCDENTDVYELSYDDYRDYTIQFDEVRAASQGSQHIPEVMVIGLISSYDAFLSNVLRTIFNTHEEIIFSSDKMINFSEFSRFATIKDAKDYIIDKEVESVIRKSHHEQFKWMESAFKIQLRSNLEVWPRFIEVCERRNLLTHTGGRASQQYVENCKEHKCSIGETKPGDKLYVDSKYFSQSVDAVSEIGIKLCYVMWRKFVKAEIESADSRLNTVCFNLIEKRCYKLAEELLIFGAGTLAKGGNDRTRRMMIVNLANSVRLQNRLPEAVKIIDKEDWSATGTDFQICSKAAKGDLSAVVDLMKSIGPNDKVMDTGSYRTWPVFRELRKDKSFSEAFKDVFGEELIKSTAVLMDEGGDGAGAISNQNLTTETSTRH